MERISNNPGMLHIPEHIVDPVAMLSAVMAAFSNQIRDGISTDIDQFKQAADNAMHLAAWMRTLEGRRQNEAGELDFDRLSDALERGGADVTALLQADGPFLGDDLEQAEILYRELQEHGINADAPVSYAVLHQTGEGDERVKEVVWMTAQEWEALKQAHDQGTAPYPGTTLLSSDDGDVPETWVSLDGWANRRISPAALQSAEMAFRVKLDTAARGLEEGLQKLVVVGYSLGEFLGDISAQVKALEDGAERGERHLDREEQVNLMRFQRLMRDRLQELYERQGKVQA